MCLPGSAQDTLNDPFYMAGEINWGNLVGINMNVNYITEGKYSFQVGFSAHFKKGKDRPNDYHAGLGSQSAGLESFENVRNVQFLAGKTYSLNKQGTIRINLSGGIGYSVIYTPVNWKPVVSNALFNFGRNYTFDIYQYATMSIIINPKIEFPFTDFIGFSISPIMVLNKDYVFMGIGLGGMIGKLRRK